MKKGGNNGSKFYKTTAFNFTSRWDVYLERREPKKYLYIKKEVLEKLEAYPEADKFLTYYNNIPKPMRSNRELMRAFAVVALSFYDSTLQTKKAANFLHAAWGMILRADPNFVEEEYYRKCGKMARTFPSTAAWRRYDLSQEQKDRQTIMDMFRRFYEINDWGRPGSKTHSIDRPAWYMKYVEGKTFEEVADKFGYKSKSTFVARFTPYYAKVEQLLKQGEFDTEPELLLLDVEHEVQLNESIFFVFSWWTLNNYKYNYYPLIPKERADRGKQWWCCYACLDWTIEQIAEEWLVPVSEVEEFIQFIKNTIRPMLISNSQIPITKAPRDLTHKERLPHTPKMEKQLESYKPMINAWVDEVLHSST